MPGAHRAGDVHPRLWQVVRPVVMPGARGVGLFVGLSGFVIPLTHLDSNAHVSRRAGPAGSSGP